MAVMVIGHQPVTELRRAIEHQQTTLEIIKPPPAIEHQQTTLEIIKHRLVIGRQPIQGHQHLTHLRDP